MDVNNPNYIAAYAMHRIIKSNNSLHMECHEKRCMLKKENLIAIYKAGRLHGRNQLKNNLNQLYISVLIVPGGNELIIIAIIGTVGSLLFLSSTMT